MPILTAFYSISGENLGDGWEIVHLKKGYTAQAAELIQQTVGGDLFEIRTKIPYPKSYKQTVIQSCSEIEQGFLPELVEFPESFEAYDTVFLCYPIWWFTVPPAVASFANSLDWTGKRVIPFSTSHASGSAQSVYDLRKLCVNAHVEAGGELLGQQVCRLENEIKQWAKEQIVR